MTNSKDPLKVALVGCGRMGAFTSAHMRENGPKGWLPLSHAEAIQSTKDLRLVALCDVDEGMLSRASATYAVEQCYTDYKSLILETRPDILSIATRTAERCEIIEFAANHGVKGIHTEKPLSRNMADCKIALDAIVRNDVKLTYGTLRRFMDTYRRAREIVNDGEIGDIVEISVELGKTMLMWNHPHSVDLLLFFSGCLDIDYVQATCAIAESAVRGEIVDDDPIVENAFVKFRNGVNGIITSAGGMNTRISGTKGSLIVAANGSWIEIRKKANQTNPYYLHEEKFEIAPEMSGGQRVFYELQAAVRGEKDLSILPEEIACSQSTLFLFVLSSLRGGVRLSPSELSDDFTVTGKFGSLYA